MNKTLHAAKRFALWFASHTDSNLGVMSYTQTIIKQVQITDSNGPKQD